LISVVSAVYVVGFSAGGLGSGFSNLITEVFPFLIIIVLDGGGNLSEDIFSVNEKILSDVVSEGFWGRDGLGKRFKSLPVTFGSSAVAHTSLDSLEKISNSFESINNVGSTTFLEVGNSGLSISEDVFDVIEALSDISETLSVDGSSEDTVDDLLDLDDIKLEGLLGFLFSVVSMVVWVVIWSMVISSSVVWVSVVISIVVVLLELSPLKFIELLEVSVDLLKFSGNVFHVHHELFFHVWLWLWSWLWSFGSDGGNKCGVSEEFH